MPVAPLSVHELRSKLAGGDSHALLDVREPWEIEIASLSASINIPMDEIAGRADELPRDKPIVVVCHHGVRSYHVAQYLADLGFPVVYNLTGGIDAWSRDIDPSVPIY